MACKFKVGDKIRATSDKYIFTSVSNRYIGRVVEVIGNRTIKVKAEGINGHPYSDSCIHTVSSEDFELINPYELHITVKGNKTIGVYKHDGKTDKAVAKCSPEDTFDFATGAKLVLDRLGVLPTSTEPIEPVEELNWKCVCVKSNRRFWTVGKIYEGVDGVIRDDNNEPRLYRTFEKFSKIISDFTDGGVQFIKLVE